MENDEVGKPMVDKHVEMDAQVVAKYLNNFLRVNKDVGHSRGVSLEHGLRALAQKRNGWLLIRGTRRVFQEFQIPPAPVADSGERKRQVLE